MSAVRVSHRLRYVSLDNIYVYGQSSTYKLVIGCEFGSSLISAVNTPLRHSIGRCDRLISSCKFSEPKWCVTSLSATDAQMQANFGWLCGETIVDCDPIKPGGPCFEPNTLRNHASFVMNEYYQFN